MAVVQLKRPYLALTGTTAVIIVYLLLHYKTRSAFLEDEFIGYGSLDPDLILEVRNNRLDPPSDISYALQQYEVPDVSMGQSKAILAILNNQTKGTFVECGALDGETRSNTLYMERYLGWRGLLIEADPDNYRRLRTKHRRAWSINACLSGNTVTQVQFHQEENMGAILPEDGWWSWMGKSQVTVTCIPLETMLRALQWTTVDYFSLDVEGHEYKVLSQMPFERLDIRTLSVEFKHVPEGKEALRQLMESKGYSVYTEITHFDDLANDYIFRRNDLHR